MSTELFSLSAEQLSKAYAEKSLSPVQVAQACFDRMQAWEPKINAMYLQKREQALQQAKASELRWGSGKPLDPLDGVPITVKENLYSAGDPAPIGTAVMDLTPKSSDSPTVARSKEAGLVMLGKTTMPDFGMLSSGMSSFHGFTRNPWNLQRNTSGSSSGAAAAVVAGYGPLHIGTDIGGSVRLPATHGGFFALKPSLGRIPISPPFMGRVAGPMTRSVMDSAMFMEVLSRPDTRDFMSLPAQEQAYAAKLNQFSVKGKRIGVMMQMEAPGHAPGSVGTVPHAEVVAAVNAAAKALQAQGAIVENMSGFMTPLMMDSMGKFFEARSNADVRLMPPEVKAKMLPFILEWATWRANEFSGADVMMAYNQVQLMREAAVQSVGQYDFVISPTSPYLPFAYDIAGPGNDPHYAFPHIAYTVAYNMSEQPAASVNWTYAGAGPDEGLPVGIQVVGQRFDDLGVMQLSRVIEQVRPAQRPWPKP